MYMHDLVKCISIQIISFLLAKIEMFIYTECIPFTNGDGSSRLCGRLTGSNLGWGRTFYFSNLKTRMIVAIKTRTLIHKTRQLVQL